MKRERSPEEAEDEKPSNGSVKAARQSPEDTPQQAAPRRKPAIKSGAECPYLDTISRQVPAGRLCHCLLMLPDSLDSLTLLRRTWTLTLRSSAPSPSAP